MGGSATLLQLKVTDTKGKLSRDVIVAETISLFNLHRCLQFCIKPRQSDASIDGKEYSFQDASSKKVIKAPKTAQLSRNSSKSNTEAAVGDAYIYEADKQQYRVEVVDASPGDISDYVPRCIRGKNGTEKADIDTINAKLQCRRFSKQGARSGQKKAPRKYWWPVGRPLTMDDVKGINSRLMKQPLKPRA